MMANALYSILWALLVGIISANPLCASKKENTKFIGGYQFHTDVGYYKLYSLPVTWGQAWKQCKEDGGHLAVIDSDEEYMVVRDIVNQSKKEVFIGVHDMFVDGWFFTVTGKCLLPSTYNRWRDGHQDNENNDYNCVVMNKNGELEVENCSENFNFVCEVELK